MGGCVGKNKQSDECMLRNHIAALMEHFDSVQIFATRPSINGGTVHCVDGGGNWFARYGQVSLWVTEQDLSVPGGCDDSEDDFMMEV